jgi:hypothetical protein
MIYIEDQVPREQPKGSRFLLGLVMIDGVFAMLALLWWHLMSVFLAEPMRWATWAAVPPKPAMLDYPFLLLWLLPSAGICAAWFAKKARHERLACWFAVFPILYLGILVAWFYLTPLEWH